MTDKELIPNVHNSMYHQIQKSGFSTPVQVLMDMGILSKEDYAEHIQATNRNMYKQNTTTLKVRKEHFNYGIAHHDNQDCRETQAGWFPCVAERIKGAQKVGENLRMISIKDKPIFRKAILFA